MTTTYAPPGVTTTGVVLAADTVIVEGGAITDGEVVYGLEVVGFAGLATNTTIEAGGQLQDESVALSTTILGGGLLTVGASGVSEDDLVYGVADVHGTIENATIYSGGLLTLDNFAAAANTTIAGGTFDVMGPDSGVGLVAFSGPNGRLELGNGVTDTTPITGFSTGDSISISAIPNGEGATLGIAGDEVIITGGGASETLNIVGASMDQLSLTQVDGSTTLQCVCFLPGTAIATPLGQRPIETLRPGDMVLTVKGGSAQPVRWLGRQTIVTQFADHRRVAPICIRRGALDEDLPQRDLLVSPDHAIMVAGVFVQAGALVNGVSIVRQDTAMPERFVYYHIELADHALILAEGVPAETFIDNVDRLAFDNWGEHRTFVDAADPTVEMPYPRAKAYRQLPQALRVRLVERAHVLYGSLRGAVA